MKWVQTFFALFVIDCLYIVYLKASYSEQKLRASFWAALIFLISSNVVINYTEDHSLIVPACLGAFMGTYFGLCLKIWSKK